MPRNFGPGKSSNTVGECMRSGIKMRVEDMVADGYYPELLVHPDWYEPPEPQEEFVIAADDAAADITAPENHIENASIGFPTYNDEFSLNKVFELNTEIGSVTPTVISSIAPDELTGGVLWLDADDDGSINDTAGAVNSWSDGFSVTTAPAQSDAGKKPTTGTRTLNGMNIVDFDGTEWLEFSLTLTGDFSMMAVYVRDSDSNNDMIFGVENTSGGNENFFFVGINEDVRGTVKLAGANTSSGAVDGTGACIIGWRRDGTSFILSGNDSETSTVVSQDPPQAPTFERIGIYSDSASSIALDGGIAEIVVYDRLLTDEEFAGLKLNLTTKWGL